MRTQIMAALSTIERVVKQHLNIYYQELTKEEIEDLKKDLQDIRTYIENKEQR